MTIAQALSSLVRDGAAFQHPSGTPLPVAWWTTFSDNHHFWFEPGDTHHDGHVLQCAKAKVLHDGLAVEFRDESDKMIGYVTTIEESVDDERMRELFRIVIDSWKRRWEQDQRLRAFVLGESAEAHR